MSLVGLGCLAGSPMSCIIRQHVISCLWLLPAERLLEAANLVGLGYTENTKLGSIKHTRLG